MTILLTGATGFLGSHILDALVAQGHTVIILKRSSSKLNRIKHLINNIVMYDIDKQHLADIFKKFHIEMIIHCATNYGRSQRKADEIVEANLMLPLKLLLLGIEHGIKTFINTDTLLDKRVNEYSLSKKQFLDWLKIYSDSIYAINIALEHFYGPNDDPSKFTTYVIKSMLDHVKQLDLTLGQQKRDFIYIDDVVEVFLTLVNSIKNESCGFIEYEVGTGELTTIEEFVKMVKVITINENTLLNFGAVPYRKNEPMESHVNLIALKKLGWEAKIDLLEGLKKTILIEENNI
ncbi:MAG: NAD(P)-dependent oxidoreductase [Sulfuricurvum sp.]|uniref:NAD-dependent epimerase/dehydratase family protein n=1 Tax=Sulfuricurvum sp. TaxID=2025608 RepID=UPI00262F5488|nr:NAD(P)-dependent oxidoreductase [Sulfuricurvum sp.]MDD2828634.1 NAD(P)-dependent oxidoreductase [Sulfuricurvum sp.]MDD4948311.1 NAD(P)-dependent oxidoreductase [Sulfuricurvum sp.]